MRVIIYSRVSTDKQDYKRQTEELLSYSEKMNYEVVEVFEEKISGALKNEDRPQLSAMIKFIKENKINKVLCWELSRLGRTTIEVLKTINMLNENRISLYIKNHNIETLNEDGNINAMSQFMIQILTSIGEMERTTIKQRMKSGYDSFVRNGGKVGRKEGFKKDDKVFLIENKDILKLLRQNLSVRNIMKITGKSSGTIQKAKAIITNPNQIYS